MRLLLSLIACLFLQPTLKAQERVEIPAADGVTLKGVMFRPAGTGPFPAVVALHGCGGLGGANVPISSRHLDWGRQLAAQGFVVVFPDSYGSRGLGAQCLVRDRTVRPSKERVADAIATKRWLQQQPDVDKAKVALLGWSNGGSAVLWAASTGRKPKDGLPDFHAAVAFYPGCRPIQQAAERRDWDVRIQLMLLIGDADTWTPPEPCRQLVSLIEERGGSATLVTYPNAVHEFDHPDRKPTRRTGLAFTADGSGEAMVATDPDARADALSRVPGFLKR